MSFPTGRSKVINRADTYALSVYGTVDSDAKKTCVKDFASGYISCKLDINELLTNEQFILELRKLIAGQIVHEKTVHVILNAVLSEIIK